MLWSIDSCQNRVTTDRYHLTVPRARVFTHRGRIIFCSYPLTNYQFQMIVGSSSFFQWFIWNMLCLCHYDSALLRFWLQIDLGRENSAIFFKYRRGRTFLTMVTRWSRSTSNFYTLTGQKFTGEFMRKMYAASWNLFTLTAEADRILGDVFNCLFPLDVQNEIQVLSKVFCYSRLVCLLFFGSEMRRLSKSEIRFRMVSFSFFTLLVERDQRMTIVRKVKSNRLPCL